MTIQIRKNRTVSDLQNDFSAAFPFLKLEFYRTPGGRPGSTGKQKLSKTALLSTAGNQQEEELEIKELMTVRQLEQAFFDRFGMTVQVSRKSGTIWLETTMTDNWAIKQQNDHGRELSEPISINLADRHQE